MPPEVKTEDEVRFFDAIDDVDNDQLPEAMLEFLDHEKLLNTFLNWLEYWKTIKVGT